MKKPLIILLSTITAFSLNAQTAVFDTSPGAATVNVNNFSNQTYEWHYSIYDGTTFKGEIVKPGTVQTKTIPACISEIKLMPLTAQNQNNNSNNKNNNGNIVIGRSFLKDGCGLYTIEINRFGQARLFYNGYNYLIPAYGPVGGVIEGAGDVVEGAGRAAGGLLEGVGRAIGTVLP